jgi:hypothetical protein
MACVQKWQWTITISKIVSSFVSQTNSLKYNLGWAEHLRRQACFNVP